MKVLQLHPKDNVIIALQDIQVGESVLINDTVYIATDNIPAKHKFLATDLAKGDFVYMYGEIVGSVTENMASGRHINTSNTIHASSPYRYQGYRHQWYNPDISRFKERTFKGYHRPDGRVGTANYWLFIPTVFCENRNIDILKEALLEQLGYSISNPYKAFVHELVEAYNNDQPISDLSLAIIPSSSERRLFKNIDGIKFLRHEGGCGGTREDAQVLGKLLAAYIDHPNVAGETILGLGCENLHLQLLDELKKTKP